MHDAVVRVRSRYFYLIEATKDDLAQVCDISINTSKDGAYYLIGRPSALVKAEHYILDKVENEERQKAKEENCSSTSTHTNSTGKNTKRMITGKAIPSESGSGPSSSGSSSSGSPSSTSDSDRSQEQRTQGQGRMEETPKEDNYTTVINRANHAHVTESGQSARLDIDSAIWTYITKLNNDYIQSIKEEFSVKIAGRKDADTGIVTLVIKGAAGVKPAKETLVELVSKHQSEIAVERCYISENCKSKILEDRVQQLNIKQPDYLFEQVGRVVYIMGPKDDLCDVKLALEYSLQEASSASKRKKKSTPRPERGGDSSSSQNGEIPKSDGIASHDVTKNDVTKKVANKNDVTTLLTIGSYETGNKRRIHLYYGDITRLPVDGIVNAANRRLDHMGGIAKAIVAAAGPELQEHCRELVSKYGEVEVSRYRITPGFKMPSTCVIHTLGPKWSDYGASEKKECTRLLRRTFTNCLRAADKQECTTLAIPPVSAGKGCLYSK